MPVDRLPGGTRGARTPPRRLVAVLMPIMEWFHRRSGDRFRGSDLLYLTTVGARTGELRTNPVARFDHGSGGWLGDASFGRGRPASRLGPQPRRASRPRARRGPRSDPPRSGRAARGSCVRRGVGARHRPVAQLPRLPAEDGPPAAGAAPHAGARLTPLGSAGGGV